MNNQYLVKYSQRFDQAVYSIYRDLSCFEDVLSLNEHLQHKIMLNAGDIIYLPDIPEKEKEYKEENLNSIW